jgi:hypothetical protein
MRYCSRGFNCLIELTLQQYYMVSSSQQKYIPHPKFKKKKLLLNLLRRWFILLNLVKSSLPSTGVYNVVILFHRRCRYDFSFFSKK